MTGIPGTFFDKRRDFREPVETGVALIGNRVYRLVNWSRTGFLVAGWNGSCKPGESIEAGLSLTAGSVRHDFRATVAVVRVDSGRERLAARFIEVEAEVRTALDRHFDPAAERRGTLGGEAYAHVASEVQGSARAGTAGLPALPHRAEPLLATLPARLRQLGPEQVCALGDLLFLVKIALARRCHPDAGPADGSAAVRSRIFAELWAEVEAIERALAQQRRDGGAGG